MTRKAATPNQGGPVSATASGRPGEAVQRLVDLAHAELGRGVGLDGPDLAAIAYSPQPGVVDEVRRESIVRRQTSPAVAAWLEEFGIAASAGPLRLPPNPALGMRARVCVPVRAGEELLAFLWLLDEPRRLDDAEIEVAADYALQIAAELQRERALERQEREGESTLVAALITGEPTAHPPYELLAAEEIAVAVVRVAAGQVAAPLEAFRRVSAPHQALIGSAGGEGVAILPGRSEGAADELLRSRLLPHLPPGAARIGVAASAAGVGELPAAHREARLSALAAVASPSLGTIVRWSSLGADRTLLKMIDAGGGEAIVPDGLLRLRDSDSAQTLLPTLETYLTVGDATSTAAALSIHRSTLYLRLRRIEEITGMDLRRGDDQLDLRLGLRLLRLLPPERRA
jgi:hypothetical protein